MGIEDIMAEQGRSIHTDPAPTQQDESQPSGGSQSRGLRIEIPEPTADTESMLLWINIAQTLLLLLLLMQR